MVNKSTLCRNTHTHLASNTLQQKHVFFRTGYFRWRKYEPGIWFTQAASLFSMILCASFDPEDTQIKVSISNFYCWNSISSSSTLTTSSFGHFLPLQWPLQISRLLVFLFHLKYPSSFSESSSTGYYQFGLYLVPLQAFPAWWVILTFLLDGL